MSDGEVNLGALVQALHGPAGTGGYDLVRYGRALFPDQGEDQIGGAIERSRAQGKDDHAILGEGVELAKDRVPREWAARSAKIQQDYADAMQREQALAAEKERANVKWRLLGGIAAAIGGKGPGEINGYFDQLEQQNLQHGLSAARERRDAGLGQIGVEQQQDQADRADLVFQQGQEDRQRDVSARSREDDPNSEESRLAQELAQRFGGRPFPGMTAAQFKRAAPQLQAIYETEQRRLSRQDATAEHKASVGRSSEARDLAFDRQKELQNRSFEHQEQVRRNTESHEVQAKKEEQARQIEEFAQSGFDALDRLEKQIQEQGTYEMFGPENQDFERHTTAIANAMAKLTDPGSVNRPSEVEAAMKGLPRPGLGQANSTALSLIQSARDELEQRRRRAYRIRGIDDPEGAGPARDVRGGLPRDAGGAAAAPAPERPGFVQMQFPDGSTRLVPEGRVEEMRQHGGQLR